VVQLPSRFSIYELCKLFDCPVPACERVSLVLAQHPPSATSLLIVSGVTCVSKRDSAIAGPPSRKSDPPRHLYRVCFFFLSIDAAPLAALRKFLDFLMFKDSSFFNLVLRHDPSQLSRSSGLLLSVQFRLRFPVLPALGANLPSEAVGLFRQRKVT